MKRSRFTEEQIIAVLKEHELGAKMADLCRKHGISEATFYKWKSKFGGLDVSEARRLKALEDENCKLKKLLAESMLDNAALRDLLSKNVWSAPALQGTFPAIGRSLRKCIRPLASGLRLQPSHDEMRAHRSQKKIVRAVTPVF
jgi:putative transposase